MSEKRQIARLWMLYAFVMMALWLFRYRYVSVGFLNFPLILAFVAGLIMFPINIAVLIIETKRKRP